VMSNWVMLRVVNGCQGEDGAEGFQTHYGQKIFPVIDTRTLVVASSNESTLILPKNAIRKLLMKYPAKFEGCSCAALVHRRRAT